MLLLGLNETLVTCSIVRRFGKQVMLVAIWIVSTSTQRPVEYNGEVVLSQIQRNGMSFKWHIKDDQHTSLSRPGKGLGWITKHYIDWCCFG